MVAGEIIAIIVVALLITAVFSYGFRSRGPWGTFWTFFLVLLLGIWLVAIWIQPIGPVWYRIAWVDLLFVGLLFALLLAASTPTKGRSYRKPEQQQRMRKMPQLYWVHFLDYASHVCYCDYYRTGYQLVKL